MVEHVTAREEQYGDQAEGGPQVAVLQNGSNVRRCNGDKGDDTKNGGGHGDDLHPVDGTVDGRLGGIGRDVTGQPGMDLLGRWGTLPELDGYKYSRVVILTRR